MRKRGPSRRTVLVGGLAVALLPAAAARAADRSPVAGRSGLHGLSVFGELGYAPDFPHFRYANPDAPKGGTFVFTAPSWRYNQSNDTFNTLNGFTFRGDAPPRIELVFDTLMASALDEPDAIYGLVASAVSVSEDGNRYTFELRPEARFHDGTPLTADDVVFSFETLKAQGHPDITQTLRDVTAVAADGPGRVSVDFSGKQSAKAPLFVAGALPIFSRAFYAGKDFEASTMTPPLGSGPYRVGPVVPGRSITYVRVADYWAKDLPVARGLNNFDRIRVEFYADENAQFEAFAKGDITWREENVSRNWATRYNFPAIRDGRVKRPEFAAERRADMYGFFFNLRRAKFADPRTREAIAMLFDFPWTNKNIFYGLYEQSTSFFETSEFAASGAPDEAEKALLAAFGDALPPGVLDGPAFTPPVANGSGNDRGLQRDALALLAEAGWTRQGNRLVDAAGTPLSVEYLVSSPVFERVLAKYLTSLKAIGVDATIRIVDPAQYQRRQGDFDFDVIPQRISFDATPIDGIDNLFGSASADTPSGSNLAGIKNPVVDGLVAAAGRVQSRAELVTVMRALDRVLRALHIWMPAWHSDSHRVACWDIFAWPDEKPPYGFAPETTWWFDAARAAAIGKAG